MIFGLLSAAADTGSSPVPATKKHKPFKIFERLFLYLYVLINLVPYRIKSKFGVLATIVVHL